MAIEETDRPERAVGEQADEAGTDAIPRFRGEDFRLRLDSPLFHRDPGMAAAAQAPQLRELTWEHVVRPNAHQQLARTGGLGADDDSSPDADGEAAQSPASDLLPGLKPVQLAPVPSIEELLQRRRDVQEQEAAAAGETIDAAEAIDAVIETEPPTADAHEPTRDDSGSLRRSLPSMASFASVTDDAPSAEAPMKDPSAPISFPEAVEQYRAGAESEDEAVEWAALNVIADDKPDIKPYVQPRIDSLLAALEQMDVAEAAHAADVAESLAEEPPAVVPLHERQGPSFGIDSNESDLGVADVGDDEPYDTTNDGTNDETNDETGGTHRELLHHLQRLDGLATVDDDLDVPEAAHVDEHVSGSQPVVARHSGQLPVQRPITGNTPVSAQSAVEAELNRLAYLPDQEEPLGPVEVPTIAAASQPAAPVAAVPALSQHEMYSPRQSAPVVHSRTSFLDLAANSYAPPPRRRKRHVFRNVVTFVVLLGLVGGGLFAAKYYLLDKRWDGQLKDLAGNVERQRELTFDHAVPVTTLPVEAFATKIATLSLGVTADNSQALTAEWRAFGLLSGPLDVRAIGLNAMPESPAYYDPASETIYVLEGLDTPVDGKRPAIYDFAMQRALTLALLDQTYGWGDRIAGMSPAVANGTRALYDADALATADAMTTPEARPQVYAQILEMYSKYGIPTSPSPYASVVTGWLGVALVPYLQSVPVANRPAVLKDRLISDGQALDIRRLVTGGNENAAGSRGMLFWYHTLASRVDADTAWKAALAWRRDTVTSTVDSVNRVCQVAVISVDLAELDRVDRAFQQWAKGAPSIAPAQVASVALATEGQVSISVCDPSNPGSVDTDPQPSLGGAPLRAEQFRLLLIAQSTLPVAQAACAVFGSDDITVADDRGVIDAVVGWQAPVNHPAPDPNRLGCVPAA